LLSGRYKWRAVFCAMMLLHGQFELWLCS